MVDALAEVWASVAEACAGLDESRWNLGTDCPGWSVRDQVAHLIAFERVLGGEAMPEVDADAEQPPHVRNAVGAANEAMIAGRRAVPGAAVLAEFEQTTAARLAALRALPPDSFDRVGWSPVGEAPYRELLRTRVFDSWVHEQDIRRALGRPGGRGGAGEEETLRRVASALPYVVGKKVAPPEGTVVVWDVTGPLRQVHVVAVRGGRGVAAAPAEPGALGGAAPGQVPTARVTLSMAADVFWRLGCGRTDAAAVLAGGEVAIGGDEALGRRVLQAMNFMF